MNRVKAYASVLTSIFIGNIIVTGGGNIQSLAVALLWFGFGVWVNYYISEVMR